jgi:hypothetical protein
MNKYYDVHANQDGVFNTQSGLLIDLNRPTVDMIDIDDIGAALAKICRFGGHSNQFYSVAQHSVLVACLAPDYLCREALLHDASEAYLGDVIKPLKNLLGIAYTDIENEFMNIIIRKFNLDASRLLEVKEYDKAALDMEHRRLIVGDVPNWNSEMRRLNLNPALWDCGLAKFHFIQLFKVFFNA